jgi:hypothetical protein
MENMNNALACAGPRSLFEHECQRVYTVAHSRQALVLDPAGKLRAEFYDPSTEAMAGIVRALLAEVPGAMTDKAN